MKDKTHLGQCVMLLNTDTQPRYQINVAQGFSGTRQTCETKSNFPIPGLNP